MALARPLRALLLSAVLLWCFFLYQMFKPSEPVHRSGGLGGLETIERDPNLDRECPSD